MDIMNMRVVITVLCFLSFLGIFLWAYSSRQKPRFDEAANLPFADDDMQQRTLEYSEAVEHSSQSAASANVSSEQKEVSNG